MFSAFDKKITVRVKSGTLLFSGLYIIFMLYMAWEYYWYKHIGWQFVRWHTHLFPYIVVLTILFNCYWRINSPQSSKFIIGMIIMLLLLFGEIIALLAMRLDDYSIYEKFVYNHHNYYHTWNPNENFSEITPEFNYARKFNSLGFPDIDWEKDKKNKIRLLALGDSYTEGYGASADSAYPLLLENSLNANAGFQKYEILNAGTCGSDPIFNIKNLEDRLLIYKPDIVFQTISSHDILKDFAFRGGLERFNSDTTITYKPVPFWVYPSMLNRLVRGTLFLFGLYEARPARINDEYLKEVNQILKHMVAEYSRLSETNNFKTIFIIHPNVFELKDKKYRFEFTQLMAEINKYNNLSVIDLFPCYIHSLNRMGKDYNFFYWKLDSHHNAKGYAMMSKCIEENLQHTFLRTDSIQNIIAVN